MLFQLYLKLLEDGEFSHLRFTHCIAIIVNEFSLKTGADSMRKEKKLMEK